MDAKLQKRIEALSRMTVKNGASPNEEAIAKRKITEYSLRETPKKTEVRFYNYEQNEFSIQEQQFIREWYQVKMNNRKKWVKV